MSTSAVGDRVDTASPAGTRTGGEAPRPSARRWWALAAIGLAQLMVVLDATIVNIALPSAQHELGFDNDGRQWIVTAYSLAFGSLLLLGGRLADLFGRRTTFLIGLVGFAAASALGGAASGFTMLVAARALQGVFGALLAPSALSLLTTTFTDPRSGRRRSASSARSPAPAAPSACCSAGCSPSTSTGAGRCTSTTSSPSPR
ncbi:MFS transporter [Actinomadura yumaensis]|uniref:MFS transporter n=1 Tax=Actinomadura yumaensis TaxID=111807 RepID=UPI00362112A0